MSKPSLQYKRKKRIIKPRLQWKVMLFFTFLAACSVMVQSIIIAGTLSYLAGELPHDGNVLMGEMFGFLCLNLAFTLAVVLPLNLIVGRTVTFRIAGPLYHIEEHLKRLVRGERVGPCKIRKDDELQELCELVNSAVASLRGPEVGSVGEEGCDLESVPPALPATSGAEAPDSGVRQHSFDWSSEEDVHHEG